MVLTPSPISSLFTLEILSYLLLLSLSLFLSWIGFAALILHIGVLYLCIVEFKWGLAGAAATYDVSAWGIALAQVVYVVGWCKDGGTGLSWLAFKEIWGFARLPIASVVMICLEIWYFMTIIVLTGHLEDPFIAVGSLSIWSIPQEQS